MRTVWVFGDQLNRSIASLVTATPDTTRILFVRSEALVNGKRWHRQRLHLVLCAMRRFAAELRDEGFDVDERTAPTLMQGLEAHRVEFEPDEVIAMETLSIGIIDKLRSQGVQVLPTNQMLCPYEEFAQWAGDAKHVRMEDFYRRQRKRLDVLMDGDEPAGNRWNFDAENRLPPPKDGRQWHEPIVEAMDALDEEVLQSLPSSAFGAEPNGTWATSREGALQRLDDFIENVLPEFGPYEDAMLTSEFRLAHSMLSHALNIGLLMPGEVVDAAESAYRHGDVPLASAEGFIRQIIGWREYIWNVYRHWLPEYRSLNELDAHEDLPSMFFTGKTQMRCMATTLHGVAQHAWSHHIQRLMVLGNFAMLIGVEPTQLVEWMHHSYVDGADWVMLPNVIGMSQYADGGRMSTKPYASGGAYINRMSDYCKGCVYNPKKRTGEDACPFTTLYWDFLDRNKPALAHNHRLAQPMRNMERLQDMDDVRIRARAIKKQMREGTL